MPDKDRDKALENAIAQIDRQFGKGSIMKMVDYGAKMQVESISTGSIALDMALGGGGVPRGRMVEIYGPESSGKTTLTYHIMAEAQKTGGVSAYIDTEHAFDPEYAARCGLNLDNLLISQPDNGEQALEIAETLIRSNAIDVIVVELGGGPCASCRNRGRDGRQPHGPHGPPDVAGPPQAGRRGQQEQLLPHLHQPDSYEDRRDVRQP